jgi:hypothetical protein
MTDKVIRLRVLKALLEIVRDISDAAYQDEIWIKNPKPFNDFNEIMCYYFDDFHVREILENYKEYGITEVQKDDLKKFTDILDEYSDNIFYESISEDAIINDPKWCEIREMAKEILTIFNYQELSKQTDV